jgi:alginate O-acetyltransferase complex protein AlgI
LGKESKVAAAAHIVGIFVNILAIVAFNYIGYFNKNLSVNIQEVNFSINAFILAIGFSFYSIQHIAYLIDIRKNKIKPETNYLHFLFCSTYFPKLISGPVTKYQELTGYAGQNDLDKKLFFSGFNRFLLGLFKKLVIADSLAPSIHSVFDFNNEYPGLTILTGGLLFTIQLYFDFSGYSDMAIGVSNMLGIKLPENFNLPLRATSIGDFWRKWHMSLIRFFTEYIFYPVSYSFQKKEKTCRSTRHHIYLSCFWLMAWDWAYLYNLGSLPPSLFDV